MFLVFCLSSVKLIKMHCMHPWCLTNAHKPSNMSGLNKVHTSKNPALQRCQWWKTLLGTVRDGCFSSRIYFCCTGISFHYLSPLMLRGCRERGLLESIPAELGKRQGTFRTSRHAICQKADIQKQNKKNTHTHTYGMALDSEQTLVSVKLSRTVLKASKVCSPGPQSPRCNSRPGGIVSWAAVFENERKGKTETQLHEGLPVCYCGYFYLPLV